MSSGDNQLENSSVEKKGIGYYVTLQFLDRVPNRFLRGILKILAFLYATVFFLYIINSIFAGFTDIRIFSEKALRSLLRSSTFANTLIWAIPISMAAIGAAYNERAGVINIGIEGIMLWGAWGAIYFTFVTGKPWMGFLLAIVVAMFIGFIHAFFTITLKGDQIVVGVAVNLLALGMTSLLTAVIWQEGRSDPVSPMTSLNAYRLPIVGEFFKSIEFRRHYNDPGYGEYLRYIPDPVAIFAKQNLLIFLGLALIPLTHYLLFRTSFGLRLRVIGEHPQAAATAGINVYLYQYAAVIFSAALAGIGGAMIALDLGTFADNMTSGLGFIALVAMIFGKWTVKGSVQASFFFGYFITLGILLPISGTLDPKVPPSIISMIPYVIALFGVAGFIGRSRPPKHLGVPYDPSEE